MNIITFVHQLSTGFENLLIAVHIYVNEVYTQYFKLPILFCS